MTSFKRKVAACVAICITAILGIAVCGCDDLGSYENAETYCASFGDVIFLGGAAGSGKTYSVTEYFYNDSSREDFLTDENGVYKGVEHSDYVYVAIPFNETIEMDTLAMYMQAKSSTTVYINVYLTDKIPTNWKTEADVGAGTEEVPDGEGEGGEGSEGEGEGSEPSYDDPDPQTRVGEIALHLNEGAWGSFSLDSFDLKGKVETSMRVRNGQYILLQIRNNSGVRVFDEEKQLYVDAQTGLVLEKAEITMTNLLIRAL